MRVTLVTETYFPQVNGVSRTLGQLMRHLEGRGDIVQLVQPDYGESPEHERVHLVRSVALPFYKELVLPLPPFGDVRQAIDAFAPDIVHIATEATLGLSVLRHLLSRKRPTVSSFHTNFDQYSTYYRAGFARGTIWRYLRWFHNTGRMTWAPSEIVRGELESNGFANTRVWSRGVDPGQFHPRFRSNELRRSLGVPDGGVLAVYIGRLAPEKGIHVALEGMRQVMERDPSVRFALAGHGPDEERCRATAPPGTVFMGRLTGRALSEFYASADIFVFPSITETFGNVVLEAMSSHLALVAPDWGATTELATTETALQFPAQDPAALAAAVERLVHDETLRRRLSDAAFAVASTRTWDSVFDRLVADYREALKA